MHLAKGLTDVGREQQFLCGCGWIKRFFEAIAAHPGDWGLVEESGPYRYNFRLKSA